MTLPNFKLTNFLAVMFVMLKLMPSWIQIMHLLQDRLAWVLTYAISIWCPVTPTANPFFSLSEQPLFLLSLLEIILSGLCFAQYYLTEYALPYYAEALRDNVSLQWMRKDYHSSKSDPIWPQNIYSTATFSTMEEW